MASYASRPWRCSGPLSDTETPATTGSREVRARTPAPPPAPQVPGPSPPYLLWPPCALQSHVKALGLRWPGPQGIGAAHGDGALRASPPGIVDLVRGPHDQRGDFGRVTARDQRLTADEPGRFTLCLAIAAQELAGLVEFVRLGPVVREHTDHMTSSGRLAGITTTVLTFSRPPKPILFRVTPSPRADSTTDCIARLSPATRRLPSYSADREPSRLRPEREP